MDSRFSRLSADDLHLFNEGRHYHLQDKLGSHAATIDGQRGRTFGVWAPNAARVSVVGDFNGWRAETHPLARRADSGIWEGFVPGVEPGAAYKFQVVSSIGGYRVDKADPFAVRTELPPRTASIAWDLDYAWNDAAWMATRGARGAPSAPLSIYEVHLGSWRRSPHDPDRWLSYRDLAPLLAEHAVEMGFTHVELLPAMEHPFYASWGYQVTGYFAPTARYGTPQDFMALVDTLHQAGIGVILDWVPSHFPTDELGLIYFDGTHLYEHADQKQGFHPDWKTAIFNYGRHEVRSFLVSNALFWLERYHADGLRVDAVASMLYLDYSRRDGQWIPNRYGGRENLEAIDFLRQLNDAVAEHAPGTITIAEESTDWPGVTRPTYAGGLGFTYKWDMGWMHDTLAYAAQDPVFRKYHHDKVTFRMLYAFNERYVLPLSHDEVVHGKASLVGKLPGEEWQRYATLRAVLGEMFAQPGKKLLFMGGEFGQWREWAHERSLDWHLLQHPPHRGLAAWVRDLNRLYAGSPAMHAAEDAPEGFYWIDCHDADHSVFSMVRQADPSGELVLAVINFTPLPRTDYRVGAPRGGSWREALNSDALEYGGSGTGNLGGVTAEATPAQGQPFSLRLTLPPLAALFFLSEGDASGGQQPR